MPSKSLNFMIENGLNLRDVVTTGSTLHIEQDFIEDSKPELNNFECQSVDVIGEPVSDFAALSNSMVNVDTDGMVKKKILDAGGGLAINETYTISICYSGYVEMQNEAFDVVTINKPMVIDLSDNGLLPGLHIAVKSMLVGETSMFLLSYKVMYGEMGIPPRIKPKMDCVFYIRLLKSTLTRNDRKINYSEPNMFQRVYHEVKLLYASGSTLFKTNNTTAAIQVFQKGVNMLHKCRLADENEERLQEKMLKKIYINLAICYNKVNKPLMACTACNELNRLNSLWNNGKVLFQNAKALRSIHQYDDAEKRLKRAIKLIGEIEEIRQEYELLEKLRLMQKKTQNLANKVKDLAAVDLISEEFKAEVDELLYTFKANETTDELFLPANLNSDEMAYFKQACTKANLFCKTIQDTVNEESNQSVENKP